MQEAQKQFSNSSFPKIDKNANNKKIESGEEDDFEEDDDRCGFGCFSPNSLQRFATKRAFM